VIAHGGGLGVAWMRDSQHVTILIVPSSECGRYPQLMEQAFRLRHRVFVEERGWTVLAKPDGMERDALDTDGAVHYLVLRDGAVIGYARRITPAGLVPGIETKEKIEALAARPGIVGMGRLCVEPNLRGGSKVDSITAHLFLRFCEHLLEDGHTEFFAETDPILLMLLRLLGFKVTFIGKPMSHHGKLMLLGIVELSEATLSTCRRLLKLRGLQMPTDSTDGRNEPAGQARRR
jgi:acyl-homoserine lactone synthase